MFIYLAGLMGLALYWFTVEEIVFGYCKNI
jgi:hypothetical protein